MVAPFSLNGLPLPLEAAALARTICTNHNLTSTQLYCKWEAFALLNTSPSDIPTLADLTQLAATIRDNPQTSPSSKLPALAKPPNPFTHPTQLPFPVNVDSFFDPVQLHQMETEAKKKDDDKRVRQPQEHVEQRFLDHQNLAPVPDPNLLKHDNIITSVQPNLDPLTSQPSDEHYANRTGSGRIEAYLNHTASQPSDIPPSNIPLTLTHATPHSSSARYMNDHIPNRIQSIRNRITTLSQSILDRVRRSRPHFPDPSPDAFFEKSSGLLVAVGRIRVELDEAGGVAAGRINPTSVLLESTDGHIVKLDLARLNKAKYPLFLCPGMVVVVEGMNMTGRNIDVHALYDNCVKSHMETTSQKPQPPSPEQDDVMTDVNGEPQAPSANIIVASGPFTTSANLKYEPLQDLLQQVVRSKPHLVLLTGPFVDANHPQIGNNTPVPFHHIFMHTVISHVRSTIVTMQNNGDNVPDFVIIPSLDDVQHHFVCPQPSFTWPKNDINKHANIHFFPNPAVIKLSTTNNKYHTTIGVTSLPTLQDISADNLCWNKQDRLAAIVSHIIRQQSFYPMFPANTAVPLDTNLLDRLSIPETDTTPSVDMIIVPSKLKTFVKCVDAGAVAVNPGLLCRASAGGTYAEVSLQLHEVDKPRPSNYNEHNSLVNVIRL